MPTIKLISGTFRQDGKTYTPDSPPFDVTDRMAGLLNCKRIEPEPEHDIDALRAEAYSLGIEVKKQWSADKLLKEIAAHGPAASE